MLWVTRANQVDDVRDTNVERIQMFQTILKKKKYVVVNKVH